jgi:hypothetical protein
MCFEHEIFFQWYSGYDNAKTRVFFLVVLLITKRGGKKRKKRHGIDEFFFLDIDIDFQFDSTFVVLEKKVAVATNERAYVMHYMGVIRSSFFPRNIVLG